MKANGNHSLFTLYVAICLLTSLNCHRFPLLLYISSSKVQSSKIKTKAKTVETCSMLPIIIIITRFFWPSFFTHCELWRRRANSSFTVQLIFFRHFLCVWLLLLNGGWQAFTNSNPDLLWVHDTVNLCDNEICRSEVH